jgi:hypothetical protein
MDGVRWRERGYAKLGFIWASMVVRRKANANGKIVLGMDLVGSRNVALDLDLARPGVKPGPTFGKTCAQRILDRLLWRKQLEWLRILGAQ